MLIPIVVAILVTLAVVAPITWFISGKAIAKSNDEKIGNANERAREIIDEALKTAETKKKEALLEVKEESLRMNLRKRQRKDVLKYKSTRSESFLKKKLLIERSMQSRNVT